MKQPNVPPAPRVPVCDLAYVIQADLPDAVVKIGRTRDVRQRFATFKQAVPFPVRLVATLTSGAKREREMKERFAHAKVKGEWFAPCADINAYLREAYAERALVRQAKVDAAFADRFIRPAVLEYLNGREAKFGDGGDLVFRFLHCGFPAIQGREHKLIGACPGSITVEMTHGYLPLEIGDECPQVFLPAVVLPSPTPTGEAA